MDQVFMHRYEGEFLAGIAAKQLRIAVDRRSGAALGYHERAWCARDDANVAWKRASGRAVLLSYTVTRRPYSPDFPVPLVHGLVELEEGPQLVCRIVGTAPEAVTAGMALKASYDDKGLLFRRARNAARATHA
ncbi:OB-fold domain-containing protein [Caenimonas sedimenti]|uniref:OB-fold domain-containing protein n=1 Tax=Caenimonas sedimenti TaxID=2596921 RepID=A0A562ZRQ1_9BURK|nr:OB-fold domain-containing protein [Caenimonas sedimenti]TWO71279.1 OB-fold domain-containing protein [Caenimonas sedimenti]